MIKNTQNVQICIDKKLKEESEIILNDLGLDIPTAFRIFLKKVTKTNSIPFHLNLDKSEFSKEFENEVLRRYYDKKENFIGPFDNMDDAIKELHK